MSATIDRAAYFTARRAGESPLTAAYAARPPVVELDWSSHYQADEEWATVEIDGRRFRVEAIDPTVTDGGCTGCAELVEAHWRQDDGIAWMTPEEYDATEHRILTVAVVDADDEPGAAASLGGVCGTRTTPTERRLDDRHIAETVVELAAEALQAEQTAARFLREREAARVAAALGYPAAFAA